MGRTRMMRGRRILKWSGTVAFALLAATAAADLRWAAHWYVSRQLHLGIGAGALIVDLDLEVGFRRPGTMSVRVAYDTLGDATQAWFRDYWLPTWTSLGRHYLVYVPLWIPMLLIGVPTGVSWWHERRREAVCCCAGCGYDLTGNVSGRCPECGAPVREIAHTAGPE